MEELDIISENIQKQNVYKAKSSCRVPFTKKNGSKFNSVEVRVEKADYNSLNVELSKNIMVDSAIEKAPDGVYCYMVFPDGTIAFVKVKSVLEFGTTHGAIVYKIKRNRISFAGEFKKAGSDIFYNFLSGTYLSDFNTDPLRKSRMPNINNARNRIMKHILGKYNLNAIPIDKTVIDANSLPLKTDEVELLKKYGVKFIGYEKREDCGLRESNLLSWLKLYPESKDAAKWRSDLERIRSTKVVLGGKRQTQKKFRF